LTGASMPFNYVRTEGQAHGLGTRLMAIVAEGQRSRIYLSPAEEQVEVAASAAPAWHPEGDLPNNPRDFKTPNYGLKTFASLFTPRQLVALTTFSDLVGEAREKVLADARAASLSDDPTPLHEGGIAAAAYADAVVTYLAFIVDRAANYGSSLSTWLPDDNAIRGTFGRQALPMTWDFCEGSYFGKSSADIKTITNTISDVIAYLRSETHCAVCQIDAPPAREGRDGAAGLVFSALHQGGKEGLGRTGNRR
jgi:putative DNA methylase